MSNETTIVFGIPVPSVDPFFLAVVQFHILVGIICVVAGIAAMLSQKRRGRYSTFGTIYYWCLSVLVVSATGLSLVRWTENYHLFFLGALPHRGDHRARRFAAKLAQPAQSAPCQHGPVIHSHADRVLRRQWQEPTPVEGELPPWAFWVLPAAVGVPIIMYVMLRHPLHASTGGTLTAV